MRFGVLGPLAVWTTSGEPVAIPGLKVRTLLADLLVHEGRPVPADRLIDDLWGDDPPGNPAGALAAKVSQLRRVLEDAEPGCRDLVARHPAGYVMRADTDVAGFLRLLDEAALAGDPSARAALLADALASWRGPAFADFGDEPFARPAIARLEERWLTAQEDRAEVRLELGEHVRLAGELGDLLAAHPLRERLRAAHMRALYRSGRQSEALDSYEELRVLLAGELGLDPGSDLVALHRAVLAQDPALAAPGPLPDRPGTNLPAPLTDLVGREEAVAGIRALLEAERLVTLTGPGGVGKTRLAVETARQLTGSAPPGIVRDGVWLVELAALDRPGDEDAVHRLAEMIMTVLDVQDIAGAAPVTAADRLTEALRPRRLLLVLDNCEHVVEPVAELAGALLRAAPGLRILATGQEPIALPGEVVWSVPPLEVPGRAVDDIPALERTASVRLFVARASAVTQGARGFALDADTAPAVATLCRRLDGIPLALELAATRVPVLGVHGLVARLDDRFRLLSTGHRGVPPRQQTLTAMIDWSWDLLTDAERAVLRRLAVHADGCTMEAAEAVCAEDDLPAADVLDLVARLVNRSLVVMVDGADGPRYRLLESVAAYCVERLQHSGEYERVRRRHLRHYTGLAERAEPRLYEADQRRWLRRLDSDAANLRAALNAAVRDGDAGGALRLVGAMAWYWFLRGRLTEAHRSLAAALAVPGGPPGAVPGGDESGTVRDHAPDTLLDREPDIADGSGGVPFAALRARALTWKAVIVFLRGDVAVADREELRRTALEAYEDAGDPGGRARAWWILAYAGVDLGDLSAAGDLLDRALPAFEALGDRWGTAATLALRAKLAHVRGDLDGLGRDGERSARIFGELGERWGQLESGGWLGALAEMTGDLDRAERLQRDGMRLAEELGLWTEFAGRLGWLGWIALQRGDYARAAESSERSLRLAVEQGHRPGQTFARMGLAFAARRDGRLDVAETHLRDVLDGTPPDAGEPPPYLPMVVTELGFVAELRGDAATALTLHLSALDLVARFDGARAMTVSVYGLAGALAVAGHHDRAARLLGAGAAALASGSMPLTPLESGDIDRITARIRDALGEERFATESGRGASLTAEQIRSLAVIPDTAASSPDRIRVPAGPAVAGDGGVPAQASKSTP
ncbi:MULTISPECIES: BTAD domain-containing putative transcriptional regulator [unclassified Streptosporangium]|uniref:BTAD domain-containing putative transcriptional regulator n=1 Tax=unclassified Streptosporangium TaxID=2632669 RepID=UPI002E2C807C|nr:MULTISPECIES: BTAD domain-containing putative transcriptional regulator [unclassified Streptosporangium]